MGPAYGRGPATHGAALAAVPWQRSPGSRFVRLRSHWPRLPNGFARWLPVVAIAPPWSPGGASRTGSPSAVVRRSPSIASSRRRLNWRSPAWARVAWPTGSLRAGKIWIPLHGIILPAFGRSGTGGSAFRPRELDAVPPEPPLKFAHPVGAVAHVSDLLDPAGNRDAHAGALRALGLSLAGHVALGQFGPPAPASPISPRGEFSNPPGGTRDLLSPVPPRRHALLVLESSSSVP